MYIYCGYNVILLAVLFQKNALYITNEQIIFAL